jgi:hypothetical protein
MKLIHFYPNSSGISFLRGFQKYLEDRYSLIYSHFSRSSDLLSELTERSNQTDLVVITAHGTEEYIVGDKVKGEHVLLALEQLACLKNSFVFAFSCSTGALGEQLCLTQNVISYIGFNDIIDLAVNCGERTFNDELSRILKDIYTEALQLAFDEFVHKNYDVSQLAKLISLNLKRIYVKILSMDHKALSQKYSINLGRLSNRVFTKKLHSDLLTTIDSVRARIIIHGEKKFIPWVFIGNDIARIKLLIEKLESTSYAAQNEYYRLFVLAYLYIKLGRPKTAFDYYKKVHRLLPEYEALQIFKFNGKDSQGEDTVSIG